MSEPRVVTLEQRPGYTKIAVEMPIKYTDGFTVRVEWDGEDWCAQVDGINHGALGHGKTQQAALLDLVCTLGATINALDGMVRP